MANYIRLGECIYNLDQMVAITVEEKTSAVGDTYKERVLRMVDGYSSRRITAEEYEKLIITINTNRL